RALRVWSLKFGASLVLGSWTVVLFSVGSWFVELWVPAFGPGACSQRQVHDAAGEVLWHPNLRRGFQVAHTAVKNGMAALTFSALPLKPCAAFSLTAPDANAPRGMAV